MLILTRRIGETLMIGDKATVTVLGNKGYKMHLGIAVPDDALSSSLVSDTIDKTVKVYFEKNLPIIPPPRKELRNILTKRQKPSLRNVK